MNTIKIITISELSPSEEDLRNEPMPASDSIVWMPPPVWMAPMLMKINHISPLHGLIFPGFWDPPWVVSHHSSDGTKLIVGGYYGIGFSDNGGLTMSSWTNVSPFLRPSYENSSSDGSKLTVIVAGLRSLNAPPRGIYISTNGGKSWDLTSAPTSSNWTSVTSSSDGLRVAVVESGGGIYLSTNGGTSWTLTSAPSPSNWQSIYHVLVRWFKTRCCYWRVQQLEFHFINKY